jgi:hypothetical protein
MHTELGFLEIFFRISIFSMLAYKLYGLIKTQLVPLLAEQISSEKKEQMELLEKDKLLSSTQKRMNNQIYNQKQMFTLLERNVQVWHAAKLEENVVCEEENQLIIQQVEQKRRVQYENVALSYAVTASIPNALQQAAKELTKRYCAEEGKALLRRAIEDLGTRENHPYKQKQSYDCNSRNYCPKICDCFLSGIWKRPDK